MKLFTKKLYAAGVLSTSLIIAACSDNESAKGPDASSLNGASEQSGEAKDGAQVYMPNVQKVLDVFNVGEATYVRALAVDEKANSLWVGSSVGAMEIDLNNNSLKSTFTRKDGLANEYVFAINVDQNGYKWFGTNAGGMSRYKDGQWKTFFPMHGLADYWVYSFANTEDGGLWIGTWAGVNYMAPGSDEMVTYVKELVNEWVYGLDIDSKGHVWFGTEGGVSRFDGKKWDQWTHEQGLGAVNKDKLPFSKNTGLGTRSRHDLGILNGGQATYNPNYVFSVLVDKKDDTIWAGTWGGGVSHLVDGVWHNLTVQDGLAGDIVYSLAQDQKGHYWFGTNQGLSRYDGKNWATYNRHNGLPAENIYSIAVAPSGDIWIATRGATTRLGYPTATAK